MTSENQPGPAAPLTPTVPPPPTGAAPAQLPDPQSGPEPASHAQPVPAQHPSTEPLSGQPAYAHQPSAPGGDPRATAGPTLPSAGHSGLRETLLTLRDLPLAVWRGDTVGALRLPGTVREITGNGWVWWVTVFAGTGLLFGIIAATSFAKAVKTTASVFDSAFGGLTGYGSSSVSVPFGAVLGMVVSVTVAVFIVGVVRALTLNWTLRMRGVVVPFSTTAELAATAWGVAAFPLAAYMVLNFLPGAGIAVVLGFVALIVYVPYTIISEGLLYVGLNRLAPNAGKSLLVPHAMLTLAAVALMLLAVFLINVVVVGSVA